MAQPQAQLSAEAPDRGVIYSRAVRWWRHLYGLTQRLVSRFWPAAVHASENDTVVDSLVLVVYHVTTLSTVTKRVANKKILQRQR